MTEVTAWHLAPDSKKIVENDYQSHIIQINGQLIYTSPILDEPPKGTEVYISKIPCDMKIEELLPIVESCGPVYSLRLMMTLCGKNRTFAFARYPTIESAKEAVKVISRYEIAPFCFLRVTRSRDNCRLFIGQIRKELKKETITDLLNKETEGLKEVILYLSATDKTVNRGFCFAEYVNHRAAAMAKRKLVNLERLWKLCPPDSTLKVDWAIEESHVDEEIMAKVTILYVRNMMLRTTESSLREVVYKVVKPHEVSRLCKMQDFAFIHFKDRSVAEKVLSHLQGFCLDGAILEVTWAKPPLPEGKKDEHKKLFKKIRGENGLPSQQNPVQKSSLTPHPQTSNPVINSLVNQPYIQAPIRNVLYQPAFPKGEINNDIGAINGMSFGHNDSVPLTTPTSYILKPEFILHLFNSYMAVFPPAVALKLVFHYFQWGEIEFKVYPCTTADNKVLYYCQISKNDIPLCTVMSQGKTPDEATNNAAFFFVKNNYSNTFYNYRLPLPV